MDSPSHLEQLAKIVELSEPFYRLSRLCQHSSGNIHSVSGGDGAAGIGWSQVHALAEVIAKPSWEVRQIRRDNGAAEAEGKEIVEQLAYAQEYLNSLVDLKDSWSSIDRDRLRSATQNVDRYSKMGSDFYGKYGGMAKVPSAAEIDLLNNKPEYYKVVRARVQAEREAAWNSLRIPAEPWEV